MYCNYIIVFCTYYVHGPDIILVKVVLAYCYLLVCRAIQFGDYHV